MKISKRMLRACNNMVDPVSTSHGSNIPLVTLLVQLVHTQCSSMSTMHVRSGMYIACVDYVAEEIRKQPKMTSFITLF